MEPPYPTPAQYPAQYPPRSGGEPNNLRSTSFQYAGVPDGSESPTVQLPGKTPSNPSERMVVWARDVMGNIESSATIQPKRCQRLGIVCREWVGFILGS